MFFRILGDNLRRKTKTFFLDLACLRVRMANQFQAAAQDYQILLSVQRSELRVCLFRNSEIYCPHNIIKSAECRVNTSPVSGSLIGFQFGRIRVQAAIVVNLWSHSQ